MKANFLFITFIFILLMAISGCQKEYNPPAVKFESKSDFPKMLPEKFTLFSVHENIYLATGLFRNNEDDDIYSGQDTKEIWCYQASSDTWVQKNDFPGYERHSAISFTILDKAYLGFGESLQRITDTIYTEDETGGIQYETVHHNNLNDFWEHNYQDDTWKQLADFPDSTYWYIPFQSFVTNNLGFIVFRRENYLRQLVNELWEYNPSLDSWTKKADGPADCFFNGNPSLVTSSNNNGYVFEYACLAEELHVFKYNTELNQWSYLAKTTSPADYVFSLEGKIYSCFQHAIFEFNTNDNTWKDLNYTSAGSSKYAITTNSTAYVLGEKRDFWMFKNE